MGCICLGPLTSQAPGTQTRSRNQEEPGAKREQRHTVCNSKEVCLEELFNAQRESLAVVPISVSARQPGSKKGYQPRGEKEEGGRVEVRREKEMWANNFVISNFWDSKISIQLMSCQRHVRAICMIRQTESIWFVAPKR